MGYVSPVKYKIVNYVQFPIQTNVIYAKQIIY